MLELSDLIVDYDPVTLTRRPVRKEVVLAALAPLAGRGTRWALRIAATLPAPGGVLDEIAVDAVLVRAHLELQRLHEEFLMGMRLCEVLRPLLAALRRSGAPRPLRVVDMGCGLGYCVRWLARHGHLGDDVELIGTDYNQTLIRAAAHLASREHLHCRFVQRDALAVGAEPATVLTSTGVLHHFRGAALHRVLREQAASNALALLHFDIKPSALAPIGAWIFHHARMREPLAQHDGYQSAVRAHSEAALRAAARAAGGLSFGIFDGRVGLWRLARIMHALVAVRPVLQSALLEALGPLTRRLSPLEGPC